MRSDDLRRRATRAEEPADLDVSDIPALRSEEPEEEEKREWDKEHPRFAFRIRPEDATRLAELAESLNVSKDAMARALMQAALDAVERKTLDLDVDYQTQDIVDSLGRQRVSARKIVLATWISERNADSGD